MQIGQAHSKGQDMGFLPALSSANLQMETMKVIPWGQIMGLLENMCPIAEMTDAHSINLQFCAS